MRFRMRYVLIGLLIIALLIAVPVIVMTMRFTREYSKLQISEVAISSVASGVYRGLCDVGPVAAEVEVTVADGTITGIRLIRHQNGQGSSAEVITDLVIEAQSLQVDVVGGATISSKVILKAIEKALTGG